MRSALRNVPLFPLILASALLFVLSLNACVDDNACMREGQILETEDGCTSYCHRLKWTDICPTPGTNVCHFDEKTKQPSCICDPQRGSCAQSDDKKDEETP